MLVLWSLCNAVKGMGAAGGGVKGCRGLQQYHCRTEEATTMGMSEEKMPVCSDMPAPVGEVVLAELL